MPAGSLLKAMGTLDCLLLVSWSLASRTAFSTPPPPPLCVSGG